MIEEMKIGVTLALQGEATEKLKVFKSAVSSTNKAVTNLETRLKPLQEQLERISKTLSLLNPRMLSFIEATTNAKISMGSLNNTMRSGNNSFNAFNQKLTTSSDRMANLTRSASLLKNELEGVAAATGTAGAASAGAFAAAGYKARKGAEHGSGIHMRSLEFGPLGIGGGPLGFTGASAVTAGVILASMQLHNGYTEYGKYQQAYAQFQQQGFSAADNAMADKIASNVTSPGISNVAMMNALTDASMATKNAAMGRFLAPYLADTSFANNILYHNFSRKQEQDLIKFAEIRGGSDPKAILRELNTGQKLYSSTGGRVQPSDLLNFVKMSQTAGYHLTDQALFKLEPSIQEMGGYRAGTAVQTGFNQLITGKGMSTAEARDLTKLGILKPGGVVYDPLHRRLLNKPGTLKDEGLFQTDVVSWLQKDYFPALAKAGITSEDQIVKSSGYDFGRTFASLVSNILKNQDKIARANEMNPKALGIEASKQAAQKTQGGTAADLAVSYKNFNKALGQSMSGSAQGAMQALAKILNFLTWLIKETDKFLSFTGQAGNYLPSFDDLLAKVPSVVDNANKNFDSIHNQATKGIPQPTIIQLNMDSRAVAHGVMPHINHSMYLTQIQQSNTFMPGMTPISPNTGAPIR